MSTGAAQLSSDRMDWETPQDLFDALNRRFGFEVDVAAEAHNAKCARFFSPEVDGLSQRWEGVCWMNSPYGRDLPRWVEKARRSALEGATVVCLVPVRPDTRWWQDLVTEPLGGLVATGWDHASSRLTLVGSRGTTEITFVRGRLKFAGARHGAPFPSAIIAYIGRAP